MAANSAKPGRNAQPELTYPQGLGLALRIELRRDRADDARLEPELAENPPDFLDREARLIELEVNDVVVAIDLVTQAGNRLELVVEFEDLFQLPYSRSVNLKFDHKYFVRTADVSPDGTGLATTKFNGKSRFEAARPTY